MNHVHSVESVLKSLGKAFLTFGERGFVYGALGKLLRRNVESLWFDNCVVAPPYNVFLVSADGLANTVKSLHDASSDTRPFGLACLEDSKIAWNSNFQPADGKQYTHKIARVTIVTDEDNGKDVFHRKQRERKVWWRKYARNPSRFALAEAKKISKNRETIDIIANFSFGSLVLETIAYQQDAKKIYPQIPEQKDTPLIHVVEHTASLDWGCLAMLCDGYEITDDNVVQLKIHPKLSPYKVGLYLECNNVDDDEDPKYHEKKRLVVYLNNSLKAKGLGTVLTRTKRGIENYHVPMTISVDDASLVNGIVRVTSQLTTIAEAVHVTDLPKYVAARCA